MNGFLMIAFKKSDQEKAGFSKLENLLNQKKLAFRPNDFSMGNDYLVKSYQFFYGPNASETLSNKLMLSGKLYDDEGVQLSEDIIYKGLALNEFQGTNGNGMFCVINENALYFQNDPQGCRKLFYYHKMGVLCVSTHLPLILAVIKNNWRVRKNAVISMVLHRQAMWPYSFVEDIMVLPPRSLATWKNANLSIQSFGFYHQYQNEKISVAGLKENLYTDYKNSISRNFTENTAVTLSGGRDSNCILKLMLNSFNKNYTTASLGYDSKKFRDANIYDETVYAEKIAQKYGLPFKKYIINKEMFFNEYHNLIQVIDQPGHDPSSNYLLCNLLHKDGFDTVINGMGGDACFSPRKSLLQAMQLFSIAKNMSAVGLARRMAARLKRFQAFQYFNSVAFDSNPEDFHSLFEGHYLTKSPASRFVNTNAIRLLYAEKESRSSFYNQILNRSKSKFEIQYSFALFATPGEYHAGIMANRNHLNIVMPFVDTAAVRKLMNSSNYYSVNSRKFQSELFGGIDEAMLVSSKSGFSIPYAEWMPAYSEEVFEYFSGLQYFSEDDFNFESFRKKYNSDKNFAALVYTNILLWKLKIIKDYVQLNDLNL